MRALFTGVLGWKEPPKPALLAVWGGCWFAVLANADTHPIDHGSIDIDRTGQGMWGPVERKLALAGLVPEAWCYRADQFCRCGLA